MATERKWTQHQLSNSKRLNKNHDLKILVIINISFGPCGFATYISITHYTSETLMTKYLKKYEHT